MRKIKKYVKMIDDELHSAECYAEKYIEAKAYGEPSAEKFRTFAQQEIEHGMFAHDLAMTEIEKISAVYTAPADMREKWELSHQNYVEKLARIKAMLNL